MRKEASTQLVATEVATEIGVNQVVTERRAIQEAAATIVQIVREHRQDIKRNRYLAQTLYEQLVDLTDNARFDRG